MIDEDVITDIAYEISGRFEKINSKYIKIMGEHVKEIGKFTATDIHRQEHMIKMGTNIEQLKREIAKESGRSMNDINKLYDRIVQSSYADTKELYEARFGYQIPLEENVRLLVFSQAIKNATEKTLRNLAKTTNIDSVYRDIVDKAIMAVSQGVTDYNTAIREELKKASVGARVRYKSGKTRRMDSAIRMNILDGTRKLADGVRSITGEQFGADGVEVSAHALCAEDHLDIQGEQFSLSDFDKENHMLAREIGTCNCKHFITPIILGISGKTYSKEELNDYRNNSNEKITIGDKTKSRYEWSQECRRLETKMRYTKETNIMARSSGDNLLAKQSSAKLRSLQSDYRKVCSKTGLPKDYSRAYVPGYRK